MRSLKNPPDLSVGSVKALLKPIRQARPRKYMRRSAMNPVGKVGRRRQKVSRELTAEAKASGWDYCELAAALRGCEIDASPCFGEIQNCHSVKCSERGSDPVLDRETARGCSHHHGVMDSKTHEVQVRVAREAIASRGFLL